MADEDLIEEEEVLTPAAVAPAAPERGEWGELLQGRPEFAVGEKLGRATDLGWMGEAAQDPVGFGQDTGLEIIREGTLGGLSLEDARQQNRGMSDFPLQPGASAAAAGSYETDPETGELALGPEGRKIPILNAEGELSQESLPEMFTGKVIMNPAYERMSERLDNPDLTFFERTGLMMALKDMEGSETIRAGSSMGEGMSMKDKALISAAALTMFDPAEIAQMLTQVDPETGERRWPQFGIQHAPDGTIIVGNNINGARAMLNAPGVSAMDVAQMGALTAAFTPAGKATAAMKSTLPRMMVGAGTAGTTEALIQAGHEVAGGQFDKTDVALSAFLGPLIDVARPMIGLVQRSGKFIGSYVPSAWTKGTGAFIEKHTRGIKGVIPAFKNEVIEFSEKAADWLKSGRPAKVMTEDAIPEMHSPRMKILLKVVERMFLTGTGGVRAAQKEQRVEVLRYIADRFGVDPITNYGAKVLKELSGATGDALYAARAQADEAVQAMADNPEMKINIRDFRFKMRDLIEQEEKYGELADPALIDILNTARNAVWQGGKEQDFARGFGQISDWLQRLRVEASSGKPAVRAALTDVADALEADLKRAAQEEGGTAGQAWLSGLAKEAQLVAAAEGKSLRAVIKSGEVDSAVIERVMRRGNVDDIKLLRDNLSPDGRRAAQQWILHDALRFAGWRRTAASEALVSPKQFLKYMSGDSVEGQIRGFFKPKEFDGMLEYLRMTAQVEELGKGVGMAAAGGFGTFAGNAVNFATLGIAGLLGHGYQSAPIRNLFLRLYHIGPDVRAKDAIMRQLTPLLMAGGRQYMQDLNENDPQGKTYLSDEYLEIMGETREPGLIDQLRENMGAAAPGVGEEGGPDMTERLTEMVEETLEPPQ
jgi:hypothetical protein